MKVCKFDKIEDEALVSGEKISDKVLFIKYQ